MAEIYNAGTVTTVHGSKTLALSGGAWTENVVRPGDLIIIDGVHTSLVDSVTTTTELEMTTAFGPASAAGLSYEILHASYEWGQNRTVNERIAAYIEALENPVTILTGDGAPGAGVGDNQNLYIDNLTGNVYRKADDAWALIGNMKGPRGDAATVQVGSVTTGAAGTAVTIANSGTSADAVFDFTIPKGDPGDMSGANNLSELTDVAVARDNIDVYSRSEAGLLSGFRNKIINGDFDIWQRGHGPFSANGVYTADRWRLVTANASINRVTDALPIQTYSQSAFEVSGAGRYGRFEQYIEDSSLVGKAVTITFWARVLSGTYNMTNRLRTYNNTFTDSGSTPAFVANLTTIWQKFTFQQVFPPTYLDGIPALVLDELPSNAPTSQTVRVKRVSVVEGDATNETDPFSPRHIQQELALCQRYFEHLPAGSRVWGPHGADVLRLPYKFTVDKRVPPAISFSNSQLSDGVTPITLSAAQISTSNFTIACTAPAASAGIQTAMTVDAEV